MSMAQCLLASSLLTPTVVAASPLPAVAPASIGQIEDIYADAVDAVGVLTSIDSGLFESYQGRSRAEWEQTYREERGTLVANLAKAPVDGLSAADARALSLMRANLQATLTEDPYASASSFRSSEGKCQDAPRKDLDSAALRAALYACFDELGNKLAFEGRLVSRDSAIALLAQISDPGSR